MKNFNLRIEKEIKIYFESSDPSQKICEAINLISQNEEKIFKKILENLQALVIIDELASYNETFVEKGVWVSGRKIFVEESYTSEYIASLLLHEAFHIDQYKRGVLYMGKEAETEALEFQKKFLRQIEYNHAIEWLKKQYEGEWWKVMDEDIESHKKAVDVVKTLFV